MGASTRARQFKNVCKTFCSALLRLLVAIRALIVRGVFVVYSCIAVWRVVELKSASHNRNHLRSYYWLLLLSTLPLFMEMIVATYDIVYKKEKKTKVAKWFSPPVFLFLCCACPPIWFFEIELHEMSLRNQTQAAVNTPFVASQLLTTASPIYHTMVERFQEAAIPTTQPQFSKISTSWKINKEFRTQTSLPIMNQHIHKFREKSLRNSRDVAYPREENGTIPGKIEGLLHMMESFSDEDQARIMEQIILLILIFGRWLLPRGGITRDQLSQLLLVNIGMAADILELFEAFKESIVRRSQPLTFTILTLWQASLIQFCLTKTATKARKVRPGFEKNTDQLDWSGCLFCETELWAICTSLMLQDLPFLLLRMTLILKYSVVSYSNYFFTCKNTLVILLQLFRTGVIIEEHVNKKDRSSSKQYSRDGFEMVSHEISSNFDSDRPNYSIEDKKSELCENPKYRFRGGYWTENESASSQEKGSKVKFSEPDSNDTKEVDN